MEFFNIAQQETSEQILTTVNNLETAVGSNDGTIVIDGKKYKPQYRNQWRYDEELNINTTIQTKNNYTVVPDNLFYIAGGYVFRTCYSDPSKNGIIAPYDTGISYISYVGNDTIRAHGTTNTYFFNYKTDKLYTTTTAKVPVPSVASQSYVYNGIAFGFINSVVRSYNIETDTPMPDINLQPIWSSLGLSTGTISLSSYGAWYSVNGYVYLYCYKPNASESMMVKIKCDGSNFEYVSAVRLNINTSTYLPTSWVYNGTYIGLVFRANAGTYQNYFTSVNVETMSSITTTSTESIIGWYSLGSNHTSFFECYGAENLIVSAMLQGTNKTPLSATPTIGNSPKFIFDELDFTNDGKVYSKSREIITVKEFGLLLENGVIVSVPDGYFGKDEFNILIATGWNLRFKKSPKIIGYTEVKE